MASATKKKPKGKQEAAKARRDRPRSKRATPPSRDPLDDILEPERSAPALAEVDAEVLEFIEAVDRFKKQHGRPFPSWSEVLLILRQLGYRRS